MTTVESDEYQSLCQQADEQLRRGYPQEALELAERAREAGTGPWAPLLQVEALARVGRTAEAEALGAAIVREHPDDAAVRRAYIYALTYTDVTDKRLIAEAEAAVALDPTNPASYVTLGGAFLSIPSAKRATAAFERSLELDPNYRDAHLGLALADLKRRRLGHAVSRLAEQVVANPDDADALTLLRSAAVSLAWRIQGVLWLLLIVLGITSAVAPDAWPARLIPTVIGVGVIAWIVVRFRTASAAWFRPLLRHIARRDKILVVSVFFTAFGGIALIAATIATGATNARALGLAAGFLVVAAIISAVRSVLK